MMERFLLKTTIVCALLNLLAIGLTEWGLAYSELVNRVLISLLIIPYTISLWHFWMFHKALEKVSYSKKRAMFQDIYMWCVEYLFYPIMFYVLPEFGLKNDEGYYLILTLRWGLSIDLGIYVLLLQGYWLIRQIGLTLVIRCLRDKLNQ